MAFKREKRVFGRFFGCQKSQVVSVKSLALIGSSLIFLLDFNRVSMLHKTINFILCEKNLTAVGSCVAFLSWTVWYQFDNLLHIIVLCKTHLCCLSVQFLIYFCRSISQDRSTVTSYVRLHQKVGPRCIHFLWKYRAYIHIYNIKNASLLLYVWKECS